MKQYFLFGSIPCDKFSKAQALSTEDMKQGDVFAFNYYKNFLSELLDIAIIWGDYLEIKEEK